ncbi:Long-chain base-1-phosphate phosphatase [Ceratocystis pirilliformis]|uniref:Long-chain base-1-phosphate phosphatase n=1 Tax=Ceratocystis pirilliformis TaxID=259994 RepID=A0ABR3ZET8_9PEZI
MTGPEAAQTFVPPSKPEVIDAGLRSQNHYRKALPRWRYELRQKLIPLVRWETPHLSAFQQWARSPFFDSYFAITANLGTHTCFMIGLPVLFWCGFEAFGKGLVHMLAGGVFFSGFIKDLLSLPRPLSPPLQRITMSGSAALEYGFPSTHSTNALSVAVYSILTLWSPENTFSDSTKLTLELLCYLYAASIVIGRLYCGMHGFLDVICGSLLGVALGWLEFSYGAWLDQYMYQSSWIAPVLFSLIIIVLVRVHPEPADDCPCFDDSVSFAGVVIGLEFGTWCYGRAGFDMRAPIHQADYVAEIMALGWPVVVARLVFGVAVILVWREVTKPTMLHVLPHVFRFIEKMGLILPRRFFTSASQYKYVPDGAQLDTVFPRVSDIQDVVHTIRHPGRGRSVSVGPQSAADAYETIAYRERRRRESVDMDSTSSPNMRLENAAPANTDRGIVVVSSGSEVPGPVNVEAVQNERVGGSENDISDREVFSRLAKSRVRYDVEVVTKLVVYTGIGWLSSWTIPLLFEAIGLGLYPSPVLQMVMRQALDA